MSKTKELPAALLLTADECAAMCKMGVATWWRRDSAGLVPRAIRSGRTTRWSRADVELWVELGCPGRKAFEAAKRRI